MCCGFEFELCWGIVMLFCSVVVIVYCYIKLYFRNLFKGVIKYDFYGLIYVIFINIYKLEVLFLK